MDDNSQKSYSSHFNNLVENFRECLKTSAFSDISIQTKDKKFSVHRLMLGSVSELLYNLMIDNQDETYIHLPEIEGEIIENILLYIYTGYEEQLDARTRELCIALRIPLKSSHEPDIQIYKRHLCTDLSSKKEPNISNEHHKLSNQQTYKHTVEDHISPYCEKQIEISRSDHEPNLARGQGEHEPDQTLHFQIHLEESHRESSIVIPGLRDSRPPEKQVGISVRAPLVILEDALNSQFLPSTPETVLKEDTKSSSVMEIDRVGGALPIIKDFSCDYCQARFKQKSKLKKHCQSIHKTKLEEEVAEDKSSKINKDKLKRHECELCCKLYAKPKDLKNHMRSVHTGERPFVCGKCGAKFAISHLLLRHERYHLGITKYTCTDCGKAFMQKNDLKKHTRTHTGEKPFKCDECDSSFARNDYLRKHKHLHLNMNTETSHPKVGHQRSTIEDGVNHDLDGGGNHEPRGDNGPGDAVNRDLEGGGNHEMGEMIGAQTKSYYFIHDSSGSKALHTEDPNTRLRPLVSTLLTTNQEPTPYPHTSLSVPHSSPFLSSVGAVPDQILPVESETVILEDPQNCLQETDTVAEEVTHRGDQLHQGEEGWEEGGEGSRQVESTTLIMHSEQILYTIEY